MGLAGRTEVTESWGQTDVQHWPSPCEDWSPIPDPEVRKDYEHRPGRSAGMHGGDCWHLCGLPDTGEGGHFCPVGALGPMAKMSE